MLGLLCLLFLVSVGFAEEYVDFSCPEEIPDEECNNCCPENYQKMYLDESPVCVYHGTYTLMAEDVDSEGNVFTFKKSTGNCVYGMPNGPASSWSIDSGGNTIEKSGTFKDGLLIGPSYTKSKEGIVLGIGCHSGGDLGEYISGENQIWAYQQGDLPELPTPPDPDLLLEEEYKEATKEYETAMDVRQKQLKAMQVGSIFLMELEKSCPQANDNLCSALPINGKRLEIISQNKNATENEENFIEIKGEDPNEDVCENGMAKKYETIPLTNGDRVLEIGSVSAGIFSLSCRSAESRKDWDEERHGKEFDDYWSIYQHIPKPVSKEKNSTEEYAKALKFFQDTSKFLQIYKAACEKPTEEFCKFMDHLDESAFFLLTKPGKDICINGYHVTQTGDWTAEWKESEDLDKQGWYPPTAGLRTMSTQMGVHEIQCIEPSIAIPPCRDESECGLLWYFSQATPDPKPDLPRNEDFEDPAKFTAAMAEYQEKLRIHTDQLSALQDFDKMVQPFLTLCTGNHINEAYSDEICAKLDELENREEKPKGLRFYNEYGSHCHHGFAVHFEGQFVHITEDFETFLTQSGFHREKINPGYIAETCWPKEPQDSESSHWSVTNEYPGKAPRPPLKLDSMSSEEHEEALIKHKAELAKYKRDMRIFKRKSKAIENQKSDCRKKGFNYCIASGECPEKGACKWSNEEDKCVIGNPAHCKQSLACIEHGRCTFSEGTCIK